MEVTKEMLDQCDTMSAKLAAGAQARYRARPLRSL